MQGDDGCPHCSGGSSSDVPRCPHYGRPLPGAPPPPGALALRPVVPLLAGDVVGPSLSIYFNNLWRFGALALIFTTPLLVLEWVARDVGVEVALTEYSWDASPFFFLVYMIADWILNGLLAGAITFGTLQALGRRTVRIGDCLAFSVSRSGALIGVYGCVLTAALVIPFVFLVLPGELISNHPENDGATIFGFLLMVGGLVVSILLFLRYWLALPIAVVQQIGVFETLWGSDRLSRGHRGKLFLIACFFVIPYFILDILVDPVSAFQLELTSVRNRLTDTTFGLLVRYGLDEAFGVLMFVVGCVAYCGLRRVKDGIESPDPPASRP